MDDALVQCPYCGEEIELFIDEGGGAAQSYVEDCQVCCQAMQVTVAGDGEDDAQVYVSRLDD